MRAFDDLKKEGLILNIGVSNFSASEFEEAQNYSKNKIVNNQIHYNLIRRDLDDQGALDYAQDEDVLITAYSPLEEGKIPNWEDKILDEICKKYGKTKAQVAINWLVSQKNVVTIVKASNIDHLKEDLGFLGWEMESQDIESLAQPF
jgi:diketogulonate reductase-like aldo/keto reductase